MANAVYNSARASFLDADIDWSADTIKISLVRGYTFNAAHDFLNDVTGAGTQVATATLGSKTSTSGVADAADFTFSAVSAGAACDALVIYKDTGSAATSNLIAFIDTATGLPVTPNGGDISISFDSGANRIFRL